MILSLAAVLGLGLLGWHLGPAQPFLCGVVLPLSSLAVFLAGFSAKILVWASAPAPFPIALTAGQQQSLDRIPPRRLEAPPGPFWVACRLGAEALCFRSLLRNSRARETPEGDLAYQPVPWLWLAAIVFHYTLFLIVLRHLRFVLDPAPWGLGLILSVDGFFHLGSPRLYLSDGGFLLALAFLLGRRLWEPRLRCLSLPGDYFPLLLLAALAGSGLYLRHGGQEDIAALKTFAMGLVSFRPTAPVGAGPAFFAHLAYASALLLCFPCGKLMHMGGIFLSPTKAMPNNSRARRHVNPWNRPREFQSYAQYEDAYRTSMAAAGLPLERPPAEEDAAGGRARQIHVPTSRS
ncbi:MAG: sulfate reduction electron transfer complex DsrMKJOP subunit DsrM [Desulfovibrio sp.]|jgi:nitrate reductase gamma subunit|nr:sulfate reduction electron transfer complex DsrMKJOP subunit DsrM [Desulfovibrio sp.]